jgi:hypothetical protein
MGDDPMSRLWIRSKPFTLVGQRILVAATTPWVEQIGAALGTAGATPQLTGTFEETAHALEFQQPEFLIFSEGFASYTLKPNPLLDYIQQLAGDQRRDFFAVFVSPKVQSGEVLSAFSYSVNLVVHPDDLSDLVDLISTSWNTGQELYQVFLQTRIQTTGH